MGELKLSHDNKIFCIVFSRNRAAQLDLLLRSFEHYAPDKFNIAVIHKYDDNFQQGLAKVRSKFPDISFVEEENFREQTLLLLETSSSRVVTFMTDDTCWIKPFAATDSEVAALMIDEHLFSLILRCGLNTIRQCHYFQGFQKDLDIQAVRHTRNLVVGRYNFRQHPWELDFGRPFSLDGSLHLRDPLISLLKQIPWTNPRQLDAVNDYRDKISGMSALCEHNFVVTLSVNQSFDGNRADNWGHQYIYELDWLESQYLSGKVIKMDQGEYLIQTSHVELPLELIDV